jgi:hypothetical protein
MTHPVIEQAFLAQAGRLHIAQAVEDKKHSAILEYAGSIICGRRGGRYVVLGVGDSTAIQFNAPSSTVIEADFG